MYTVERKAKDIKNVAIKKVLICVCDACMCKSSAVSTTRETDVPEQGHLHLCDATSWSKKEERKRGRNCVSYCRI